ncbi:MAG: glycosyltransferase family 2 protein [Bryobacteraceae bacterium]
MNGWPVSAMSGVTAIVPTWNRPDLLERLLECLLKQTVKLRQILVVDNGSEDASVEVARKSGADVIRMGWNSGFSRAVNRGIREATAEWLVVINNDVEPEPDWLERLLRTVADTGAWFATGKLLSQGRQNVLDGTYDTVCRGACAWRAGHGRLDGAEFSESKPIMLAPLTAGLFRKELFDKAGLLDESFESHLEDVDFGLRCAMGGYRGVYVPDAVAYHAGSATEGPWNPDTVRRIARNQLLLVAKHYPRNWFVRYGWQVLVAQTLWGFVAAKHGSGAAFVRGKLEAARRFRAVRRGRALGPETADRERLARILEESEREILSLQERTGFDLYWKLYFALT